MQFADRHELERRAKRRARQRRRGIFWNIMTGIVVITTVAMVGYFLILYSDPQVSANPFPPPTLPVLIQVPSSTPTPPSLPPTWTPTPSPTGTPRPTTTPEFTALPATPEPSIPVAIATDNGDYPYAIQGEPAAFTNTQFHPGDSCDWQGVAGTVVDLQGKPVVGMLVHLIGVYNGGTIDMKTLTGGASAWYGESGYEFYLGDTPIDSTATLAVQLVDQTMIPISGRVIFSTFAACDKNLILINFKQVR